MVVDGPKYEKDGRYAAAPVTAELLSNVELNARYILGGCGPNVLDADFQNAINNASKLIKPSDKPGFYFPETGEFGFGKSDITCDMAWQVDKYGLESPGSAIKGLRPQVVRKSYKGDTDDCCWNNPDRVKSWVVDGKTCDPKYRNYLSSDCEATYKRLCALDTNGVSNMSLSKCQTFYNDKKQPSELFDAVTTYCSEGANIKDITFCKNLTGATKDALVSDYCKNNPGDTDFCGCYNIQEYYPIMEELDKRGQTLIPWCHLQTCASNPNAYKPSTADTGKCPSQQICLQGIDIGSIGGNTDLKNINFNCNQQSTVNSTPNLELQQPALTSNPPASQVSLTNPAVTQQDVPKVQPAQTQTLEQQKITPTSAPKSTPTAEEIQKKQEEARKQYIIDLLISIGTIIGVVLLIILLFYLLKPKQPASI